ncbi:MAG: hypothetical protein ACK532_07900, partial [Acidobacteriota bacterium]
MSCLSSKENYHFRRMHQPSRCSARLHACWQPQPVPPFVFTSPCFDAASLGFGCVPHPRRSSFPRPFSPFAFQISSSCTLSPAAADIPITGLPTLLSFILRISYKIIFTFMVQPELSQELWVRLIRQLGDRVGPVGFVYPLLMLAVALKSSVPRDHPLIYSLGALLSLAGAVWLALTARKARTAGPDNWINIREELRVVTLILATLWALLSGFGLYAYPNSDFSVALLFAILGWLSVGAIVFSPDLNLALIFIHLHI